jgi:hypothetical protein
MSLRRYTWHRRYKGHVTCDSRHISLVFSSVHNAEVVVVYATRIGLPWILSLTPIYIDYLSLTPNYVDWSCRKSHRWSSRVTESLTIENPGQVRGGLRATFGWLICRELKDASHTNSNLLIILGPKQLSGEKTCNHFDMTQHFDLPFGSVHSINLYCA